MKEAASKPEVAPQIPSYIGLSGTAVTSSTHAWSVAMCLHLIKSSSVLPTRSRGNCPNSFSSEYPMHDGQFSQVAVHSSHSYYRSYWICLYVETLDECSLGKREQAVGRGLLGAPCRVLELHTFRVSAPENGTCGAAGKCPGSSLCQGARVLYFPSRPQSFGRRTI